MFHLKNRLLLAIVLYAPVVYCEEASLNVVSLNLFAFPKKVLGVVDIKPQASRNSDVRMERFRDWLQQNPADVVQLQEVWGSENRTRLSELLAPLGYVCSSQAPQFPIMTGGRWIALSLLATGFSPDANKVVRQAFHTAASPCPFERFSQLSSWGKAIRVGHWGMRVGSIGAATLFIKADADIVRDIGNGLVICSKFPIQSISQFDIQKSVGNLMTWDKPEEVFLFRSVLKAKILVPGHGEVELYNTHLGPCTYDEKLGGYRADDDSENFAQLKEVLDHVRRSHNPKLPMIFAGDLNVNPWVVKDGKFSKTLTPAYRHLIQDGNLPLEDSYRVVHGPKNLSEGPRPHDLTVGPNNAAHYEAERINEGHHVPDEVIDYIFKRDGETKLEPVESSVILQTPFAEMSPDEKKQNYKKFSWEQISDHFGVQTRFRLSR